MATPPPTGLVEALPVGWGARVPDVADVEAVVALVRRRQEAVRGTSGVDPQTIASEVAGTGSWTRRQVVATDPDGQIVGWGWVHDRAAGRTSIALFICPDLVEAQQDSLAASLIEWLAEQARAIARERGIQGTQLDASVVDVDTRLAGWYADAGLRHTRTWLQMSRPVRSADDQLPPPRPGVQVRRVAAHADGMPVAEDLRAVHQVLEESFEDHWGSYRESFAEFTARLREDPGHRWDHWWLAYVDTDEGPALGGGLVSSVLPPDRDGAPGSYIDYIGVHRRARGRGVAKALLFTVIRDALERGRNRVGLEVDADSPTGADGLYTSLGWETAYRTQSWQRELDLT